MTNCERYVAVSSTRRVRGVDLEAVEKRKKRREEAQQRWNFQHQSSSFAEASQSSLQVGEYLIQNRYAGLSVIPSILILSFTTLWCFQIFSDPSSLRSRALTMDSGKETARDNPNPTQIQKVSAPFLPVTFRQVIISRPLSLSLQLLDLLFEVFFVLNGHPHRVYRALINPLRKGHFDQLLEEISQGLQVGNSKVMGKGHSYSGGHLPFVLI